MYSDAAIQARSATLEASEAYTEILMLECQPEEDAAHVAARGHNDRAGAELKNQTTTAHNVIEEKAPDEYGALVGLDTGANQLYGLSDQRYLNRLFQYASENGGYAVKHSQQRGSCLYHSIRRAIDAPLEWSNSSQAPGGSPHHQTCAVFISPYNSPHPRELWTFKDFRDCT